MKRTVDLFATESETAIRKLTDMNAIESTAKGVAEFLHSCPLLERKVISYYISHPSRSAILQEYIKLTSYAGYSLPEAFRLFTERFHFLHCYGEAWQTSMQVFCTLFAEENQNFSAEMIYPLCYSMFLLDLDFKNFMIKNKMSKREFIKNCRGHEAISQLSAEYLGDVYDFILLRGLRTIPESSINETMISRVVLLNEHETKIVNI